MSDLIIVGGGAAGLAAGIYASRYKLDTLLVSKDVGGTGLDAPWVENYPGFSKITGFELMDNFEKHAKSLGVEFASDSVKRIEKTDSGFLVKSESNEYAAKSIILALGRQRNHLNVPGEKEFAGKGVSYCATCDGPLFKNKVVAVIGGSDAAATSALLIAEHASKVYIIYRKDKLRCEPVTLDKVESNPKIETMYHSNVTEILGSKMIERLKLDSGNEIEVGGVFVEIGSTPSTQFLSNLGVKLDDSGYIIVDNLQMTNIDGLFAAGDITVGGCNMIRQIITSAAEGVIAATSAYKYLR